MFSTICYKNKTLGSSFCVSRCLGSNFYKVSCSVWPQTTLCCNFLPSALFVSCKQTSLYVDSQKLTANTISFVWCCSAERQLAAVMHEEFGATWQHWRWRSRRMYASIHGWSLWCTQCLLVRKWNISLFTRKLHSIAQPILNVTGDTLNIF